MYTSWLRDFCKRRTVKWKGSTITVLCNFEYTHFFSCNISIFDCYISHRSGYITYESTVTIKDIDLYRFIIPNELYLSGDVHEPNKGFCVSPGCLPTGLLNISVCQPMSKSRRTCSVDILDTGAFLKISVLRSEHDMLLPYSKAILVIWKKIKVVCMLYSLCKESLFL